MEHASDAFGKRIKRHILSREQVFHAVIQPSLRGVCAAEMEKSGFRIVGETDGGVEFSGRLREGWRANLVLRTASRIYCRAAGFRAGAGEELFRRAAAFPWELWLSPDIPLRVESRVLHSRLHHEGGAALALTDGIRRHFEGSGLRCLPEGVTDGDSDIQRVLLRLVDNHCTISLDMSGEPLYNRGYRLENTGAPIRETIAAALLQELGWDGRGILVDGMTGSGTFAIEAGLIAKGIPPGRNRTFRFQSWPSFGPAAWNNMRERSIRSAVLTGPESAGILACDLDEGALRVTARNLERAGIFDYPLLRRSDFFSLKGNELRRELSARKDGPAFLVLNPPYGRRIEGGDDLFFRRLGGYLKRNFAGWKVLVLFPGEDALSAFGGGARYAIPFRHGGLRITAGIF